MPPRSRYAVDPSLSAPPANDGQSGYSQSGAPHQQQTPQQANYRNDPNYDTQLHQLGDHRQPPAGEYAPAQSGQGQYSNQMGQPQQQQSQQQFSQHPTYAPPSNHIPAPPHSSGPQMAGPRVRIDPSQVPNPVEAQELDQNLYDDDDFLSCQPRGVMPLAGTDYRGVDQGELLVLSRDNADCRELASASSKTYTDDCTDQCPAPRDYGSTHGGDCTAIRSAAIR
jgi:protein transport protein SEC24